MDLERCGTAGICLDLKSYFCEGAKVQSSLEYSMTLINPELKDLVEFGVYTGDSLGKIKAWADDTYNVYGFDSFIGLPEDWPGTVCHAGFFSTNGVIPDVPGTTIYPGWFKDTLPDYIKVAKPIGLLHLDCDLYSSTKDVLFSINDFIVIGTIIVCDEWVYNSSEYCNDQEQRAVLEWMEIFDRELERIEFDDQTPCGCERAIFKVTR